MTVPNQIEPTEYSTVIRANFGARGFGPDEPQQDQPLKTGGGDGTSGGMDSDWKTSVDTQLGRLHDDVRHLLIGGIAATALVFSAIIAAYLMLSGDVKTLSGDIKTVQVEQARVAEKVDAMDRTVTGIDGKLDKVLEDRRGKPAK